MAIIDELREEVEQVLSELDGVLALRADHGGAVPHLYRPGDDLSSLTLSPRYPMALTLDLLFKANPEARLGVVARGCDERALIEMAKRCQVDLNRVRIIGFACTAEEAEECRCAKPFPENLVAGEKTPGVEDALIAEHRSLSPEDRLEFWRRQFAKCYKCYGCRDICPLCFCEECTLEDDIWVERGVLAPPFPAFHLIRAMHTAGKCVGCNECERSCPADIPLTILYSLLRQDVGEMFGYVPGASVEDEPPLAITLSDQEIG